MSKKRSLHGLGELQAEVLEIVWELGQATVAEVHQRISKRRPVTYTTILVPMQKLEQKGWLTHERRGRANVYRPARSREEANAGLLRNLLQKAFLGDPGLLLSQLLDEHPMNDTELDALKALIDTRRKGKRRE